VTGEYAGKDAELTKARGDMPTVYLFVNAEQWSRPMARYLKTLDQELDKGIAGADGAAAVAIWLTGDVNKYKEYLPKAQQSMQFQKTSLTVFDGEASGPAGWNVDIAAHLTVVVTRGGKETARFSYRSTNESDVPEAVKALAGK
jgi:hypothetical protein